MDFDKIRKEAYKKVLEIMQIINAELEVALSQNLDSIQYRIKSEESIKNKMKKVRNNIFDVYDLIGIRYIFQDIKDLQIVKNNLINIKEFVLIEEKDYLQNGHPEDSNYKAIHLRMKYQEYPFEVELLDTAMALHVLKTHDEYKKGLLK